MIGELGSTTDPVVLVPGSVQSLRADADDLDRRASDLGLDGDDTIGRVVASWTGDTAEIWAERRHVLAESLDAVAGIYQTVAAVHTGGPPRCGGLLHGLPGAPGPRVRCVRRPARLGPVRDLEPGDLYCDPATDDEDAWWEVDPCMSSRVTCTSPTAAPRTTSLRRVPRTTPTGVCRWGSSGHPRGSGAPGARPTTHRAATSRCHAKRSYDTYR